MRQALLDELDGLDSLVANLVHRTVAAGVPDVAKGKQFAAAVVDQEQRLAKVALPLRAHAEAIDVSSGSRFDTTVQSAVKAADEAGASTKKAAAKLAAVTNAPAVLFPIAGYLLTPKASMCASK